MDTEEITLPRERWETLRTLARQIGDGVNAAYNVERLQSGGFPGSTHEASPHWAIGRVIGERLEATEGDPLTLALGSPLARDMRFYGYLPQGA